MKEKFTNSKNLSIKACYNSEEFINQSLLWWQKQERLSTIIKKWMMNLKKKRSLNRDIKNSIDFENEDDEIFVKIFFVQ